MIHSSQTVPYPNSTPTATQPSQSTEYDSAWILNDPTATRLRKPFHLQNFSGYAPRSRAAISSPSPYIKRRCPQPFTKFFLPSSLFQSKPPFYITSTPKNLMAGSGSRRRASDEVEGSRAGSHRRWWSSTSFTILSKFLFVLDDPLCFRLIQWNPATALVAKPALPDDSSESYNYSPSRYGERDALRFKAEHDETRLLTVKICQPSHEFTFDVGISFIPYPLVLTPVV
jgi:hypothetical protein